MDGILWILRTGSPWRDLPEEFGPWQTVGRSFDKWNGDGTLSKVVHRLRGAFVDIGEIDKDLWCIDGTIVRAARCASGGGKKGIRKNQLITRQVAIRRDSPGKVTSSATVTTTCCTSISRLGKRTNQRR